MHRQRDLGSRDSNLPSIALLAIATVTNSPTFWASAFQSMHIAYLRSTQNNFKDAYFLMGGRPIFFTRLFFFSRRISHGIVVQADQEEPPFYSGAEIVFQCHPGYEIRRVRHKLHNRLACQDNGLWAPPRSYQSPKCFPIQCSPPASDPFGRIVNQPPLVLTYNSTLEIICIPGYQLPQGNRHQIVRCNESGGWESVSNQERRQR